MQTTYASSIAAATTHALSEEFGVSLEEAQLSTAIFLWGVSVDQGQLGHEIDARS